MFVPRFLGMYLLIWLPLAWAGADVATCKGGGLAVDQEDCSLLQENVRQVRTRVLSADDEMPFIVTRGDIETDAPGLAFRNSMRFDDRDTVGALAPWGSTVQGVSLNEDWLRVGARYLPTRVFGKRVLQRAPPMNSASLAVTGTTGRQPAAEEGAEAAPATENPEAVEAPPEFDGVVVEFGLLVRSFPLMDFQSGTFTTSLVLTQRWPQEGFADGESPNLAVTNHDIGGMEVSSTSTTVNETDSTVTQVDYLTVRVRQAFELKSFPFDQQTLELRVAPASPGAVDMKLVPMNSSDAVGMDPQLVEGQSFSLVNVTERGELEPENVTVASPARGLLEVKVKRRTSIYFSSLFLPALLLLCVCWAVFFLPASDPSFAVPRAAVTATAFLATLVFTLHVEQVVPARTGRMWIDVFTENVSILVFGAVAFSTLEQYVLSHLQRPDVARNLNRELRILYPSLSAFMITLCCCATCGETLSMLSAVCRITLATVVVGYIIVAYGRAVFTAEPKPSGPVIIRDGSVTFCPAPPGLKSRYPA